MRKRWRPVAWNLNPRMDSADLFTFVEHHRNGPRKDMVCVYTNDPAYAEFIIRVAIRHQKKKGSEFAKDHKRGTVVAWIPKAAFSWYPLKYMRKRMSSERRAAIAERFREYWRKRKEKERNEV